MKHLPITIHPASNKTTSSVDKPTGPVLSDNRLITVLRHPWRITLQAKQPKTKIQKILKQTVTTKADKALIPTKSK